MLYLAIIAAGFGNPFLAAFLLLFANIADPAVLAWCVNSIKSMQSKIAVLQSKPSTMQATKKSGRKVWLSLSSLQ